MLLITRPPIEFLSGGFNSKASKSTVIEADNQPGKIAALRDGNSTLLRFSPGSLTRQRRGKKP
jgi:hypothetical protein